MALASYLLGAGVIGHDPVADPSAPGTSQQLAPLIDPFTHDAVLVDSGLLQGVHPVDQAVALAFGVARGTLASAPDQGHTLGEVEHAGRDLEAQVDQRVRQALALLLDRGDIALLSVVTQRREGGFVVEITYQNLRLPGSAPQARVVTFA